MFRVSKNLFIYRLNERDNFWPQVPTIALKKNRLKIFFSFRKKREAKTGLSKARVGYIEINSKFQLSKKLCEISVKENSLKKKYANDGLMPGCFESRNNFFLTGWKKTSKYPHKTYVLKGKLKKDTLELTKVYFKNKIFSNGPFIFKNQRKKIFFFSLGLKWFLYKNKYENIYQIRKYENKKIKSLYKVEKNEVTNRPTIIKINSEFYVFFCKRKHKDFRNQKNGYKIYFSKSKNLSVWSKPKKIRYNKRVLQSWNSGMQCYPYVFKYKNKILMAYCGNYFGRGGFSISELQKD